MNCSISSRCRNCFFITLFFSVIMVLILGCERKIKSVDGSESELTTASFLRLVRHDGYVVADIMAPGDSTTLLQRLVLVPRNAELPDSLPEGTLLRTPLRKVIIYSSVHEKGLELAGNPDAIVGVADAQYFSSDRIRNGLAAGKIADIGSPQTPSAEKILSADADAIILNVYDNIDLRQVERLGVPIIKLTDSYETLPLGRAEWIKLYGELFGKRAVADSIYADVVNQYCEIRDRVKGASRRPKVMTDNMYQGVWYVPGGNSYQAELLKDAGGNYIFSDDKSTGSLSLSFEEVLERGSDSDIWIIKSFGDDITRNSLLGQDKRYRAFAAVDNGGVYYCNTLKHPVFDDTAFLPHLLLSDYAMIFHPELFQEMKLRCLYFEKMKQ